jgi:hypothetical protein
MHPQGVEKFQHYYVGINSLAELATREDRVCVLNITGGESRSVTLPAMSTPVATWCVVPHLVVPVRL